MICSKWRLLCERLKWAKGKEQRARIRRERAAHVRHCPSCSKGKNIERRRR